MVGHSSGATEGGSSRLSFMIVSVLFLLSGMSSLIYQVIWTRMLVFVFGSTTFATSTVLAVFMGGLALGSFLAGRYADKIRNPFLFYGILEGIIGLWALLAPVLFNTAIPLYKTVFEQLHLQVLLFGLLRFAVAAVILLPPTACMGATLPLLARFVTQSIDKVGDRVGKLYAINTLGAVVGGLCGGFLLLPTFGLNITTLSAAALNFLLAGGVYYLSKIWSTGSTVTETKVVESTDTASQEKLPKVVLATMIGFSISGALAMIYEVAWTRTLLMVIGSTTYAFTVMLSAFLIGIFAGSFICSKYVDKIKSPITWFAFCEILLCLAGISSVLLFNYLPYGNLLVGSVFGKNLWLNMLFRFCGAGLVLIPVTLVLGVIFPLAVKVCARDLQKIGSSVGQLYSMNTLGAIAGAFLAGFVIIPQLGTEQTLIVTSVANLLLGFAILILFGKLKTTIKVFASIGCIAIAYWAFSKPQLWDYYAITFAQPERRRLASMNVQVPSYADWQKSLTDYTKMLFYKEGKCANVAISRTANITTLLTNGHVDASDYSDMENQAMLAAYPLLLRPAAKDVCVVGWGSGVTAGYALRFPIKKMICAEIEPVVIDGSVFFHKVNYAPEKDSRTVIEPSDGRNYLLGTSRKFDVIVSEPSNPWQAGVCNLFTKEYFQVCKDSLAPNGIFTFWTQINEIPTKNMRQVFAGLSQVFPNVFVLRTGHGDVTALASQSPILFNIAEINAALKQKEIGDTLSKFKLSTAEDFISRIEVCPVGLQGAVQGSDINSDDTNHLEYDVSKSYEARLYTSDNDEWFLQNCGPIWDYIDWKGYTAEQKAEEMAKISKASMDRGLARARLWALESMKVYPNAHALSLIAEVQVLQHRYKDAEKTIAEGIKLYPQDSRFPGLSGVIALRNADYVSARLALTEALKLDPNNASFHYYLAATYSNLDLAENAGLFIPAKDTDASKVVELAKDLLNDSVFVNSRPAVVLMLADAYRILGKYDQAIALINGLLKTKPNGYLSWQILGETYGNMKDTKRSAYCWNKAFSVVAADIPGFITRAKLHMQNGNETAAVRQLQNILEMSPANFEAMSLLAEYATHSKLAASYYGKFKGS